PHCVETAARCRSGNHRIFNCRLAEPSHPSGCGARMMQRSPKLLIGGGDGVIRHLPRAALASLFGPGDLVVANDAATLPASLKGIHYPSGRPIEVRLAAWISAG